MPAPAPSQPDFFFEQAARKRHGSAVAGVDEAGRGPWAGPVVAAAVILDPDRLPEGLDDSKKLTARQRDRLFDQIRASSAVGIGRASVEEIDRLNILRASLLAMERAVLALPTPPAAVLVDGRDVPPLTCPAEAVIGGDGRSLSIAAASIIAKVTRDRIMTALAADFPHFGWERNKGYGTKAHREALRVNGPTPHHRRSFAPIHKMLCKDSSLTY